MISIISPQEFKTVPWKNGKGETIELSISEGGTLEKFDWRISMASVVEDGSFSDFSGYERALILVKGNGIRLQYDSKRKDEQINFLDIAKFDGSLKTSGILQSGPINDFNIIVDKEKYQMTVQTYVKKVDVNFPSACLSFVYCLSGNAHFSSPGGTENLDLSHGSLMKITKPCKNFTISGQQLIIASLNVI